MVRRALVRSMGTGMGAAAVRLCSRRAQAAGELQRRSRAVGAGAGHELRAAQASL